MFDEDKVGCALLTKKMYARIEENVVEMYENLGICKHPITACITICHFVCKFGIRIADERWLIGFGKTALKLSPMFVGGMNALLKRHV